MARATGDAEEADASSAPASRVAGSADPDAGGAATDHVRHIRGSSLFMAGRVINLVAGFVIQVLIARHFSKSDFGAFAYAFSFLATARIFATLGHNRTITRFLATFDENRAYDKLYGTLVMELGVILSVGGALFVAAFAGRGWLADSVVRDEQAVTVLLVMLVLAPIDALDDLIEGMFAVFAKPRAIFVRRYVMAPSLRLATVVLLIALDRGPVFLAAGYVVATAAGAGFYASGLLRIMRRRGLLEHFRPRRLSMPFREVFGASLPLLSTELVMISMSTVSVVILGYHWGTAAVADFRVVRPAAVLNLFVYQTFTLLFLPLASRLFVRGDWEEMRRTYWQTAAWLAVLTFPVFGLTFAFAEPVTATLFGDRYRGSAPFLALLAVGYYVNVSLGFNALVLQVVHRLKYLVAVNVTAAAVNVVLCWWLIPRHGPLAVALSGCLTLVLQNVLNQFGLAGVRVGVLDRGHLRIYATVAVAALVLRAVALAFSPSIVVAVGLTGAAFVVVFLLNRGRLEVGETFPELRRVPLLGRLL